MTFEKFIGDVEERAAITLLMELLDQFRSAVYCQTASARHWGMPAVVNDIADYIGMMARDKTIATLSAAQFWYVLHQALHGSGPIAAERRRNRR